MIRRSFNGLFGVALGLLVLASCRAAVGDQVVTSAPLESNTAESPRGSAMCGLIPASEVSILLEVDATLVMASSNEDVCTYRAVTEGESFDVAFRTEEVFETLDVIGASFGDTVEVPVGDRALWSPSVSTLWMVEDGALYASQVVGLADDDRALELAMAISEALAERV